MRRILTSIERQLLRRGFSHRETRMLVRDQLALTGALCALALVLGWRWPWLLDAAAGALLASFNFYLLAGFLQRVLVNRDGAVANLLLRFYGRLILTAAVMVGLIAWAGASIPALLLGLSTGIATVLIWAISRVTGKPSAS
ncbi:ATP synthase subunit I [Desulfocurvus vexinensis]|uniref:ATP synthase subunit I n=1 Tax=Desulfocurvus vexinensis TaxID=399548 RepID=UPI0004BC94F7|nr:ATP synthase subunit I [Desulfocurvus vexinensis]